MEEFDLELTDVVSVEEMASNPLMLRFLELLVRLSGARRVLEIGAFIGISTMTLADFRGASTTPRVLSQRRPACGSSTNCNWKISGSMFEHFPDT